MTRLSTRVSEPALYTDYAFGKLLSSLFKTSFRPRSRAHWTGAVALLLLVAGAGLGSLHAQTAELVNWVEQSPATAPSVRYGAAMAYDASNGTTVLFGGNVLGYPQNDTWTWNGTTWTQQSPSTSPSARVGASMAYDANTGTVVLFGGNNNSSDLNDTWTWNGTTWTGPISAPAGLTARFNASMAYDANTGTVVLFGGSSSSGNLNDTWTWDGTTLTWTGPVAAPSGLTPRSQAMMAYDASNGTVALFGGAGSGIALGDTWTWNGTWTKQSPAVSPSARLAAAMAYDPVSGMVVLFGGSDGSSHYTESDTWTWNGTTWTQQTTVGTPPGRNSATMDFQVNSGTILLFGGTGLNDTWTYQPGSAFNVGTPNVCPSGASTPSPCSQSATLSFQFTAAGSGISDSVVTQGDTGFDFTDAGTGTCDTNGTSFNYAVGSVCTVNVTFTPLATGQRLGAVKLLNSAGGVIASALVYGSGVGPQIAFNTPSITLLGGGFGSPVGVAVDAKGNVFASDSPANQVKEIPAGCNSASCVVLLGGSSPTGQSGVSFNYPQGVALDGNGNLYVADGFNPITNLEDGVKKVPPGCVFASCVTTVGGGFSAPYGVAVDGSGNVYVGDESHTTVSEIPPGCTSASCVTTLGGGFNAPHGVAVDGGGNVYVADDGNYAVKEIPAGCASASCVIKLGGAFLNPEGVAVDVGGSVYVAGNAEVSVMPAGCTAAVYNSHGCANTVIYSGVVNNLTVDGHGNVFLAATQGNSRGLVELGLTTPPSLSFATTAVGSQSSDSPQSAMLWNMGNAPLSFLVPGTGSNPSVGSGFTLDAATTCPVVSSSGTDGSLAAGESCTYAVDFIPSVGGLNSSSLTITDNNLNASSAQQSIALSGTGQGRSTPIVTWPTASPITYGAALSSSTLSGGSAVFQGAPVSGSFTFTNSAAVPTAGTQSESVTFTPTDTADYNPVTGTVSVQVLKLNAGVTSLPTASAITYGQTLASSTLSGGTAVGAANAVIAGIFAFTTPSTAPGAGTQPESVTFTPTDSTDYGSAVRTVSVLVNKATPTVTWPAASSITYGQPLSSSTFSGGSASVPGTFMWTTPGAILIAGTQSEGVIFVPGDAVDYSSVPGTVSVTVNPANYVVTVGTDDAGIASNCTPQATPGIGTDASCSLRDALLQAAATGGGNISFDATMFAGPTTITLTTGTTLTVPSNTAITGPTSGIGAALTNLVAVDGNKATTVFTVNSGVTGASISNLIIQNGSAPDGGGINNGGTLTLIADSIINNFALGYGGGILNGGPLLMTESTVSGNTVISNCTTCIGGEGGGIFNGELGTTTLIDDTISGNRAGAFGGGIFNLSRSLSIVDCTISGNTVGGGGSGPAGGGGIANLDFSNGPNGPIGGNFTVANTVLSGNLDYGDIYYGTYTDGGGNVIGVVFPPEAAPITIDGAPINLAPLGNYGGPTQTMPPLPGSPAICIGKQSNIPSGVTTDQRGFPNNSGYTIGSSTKLCVDSGAVETNFAISFSGEPPASSFVNTNFAAAVTLTESGSPFTPAVTIPLTLNPAGATLTGDSAATSAGIANYTLQVGSVGTGDSLTANLLLNGALTPQLAISATSTSFDINAITPTTVTVNCPPSVTYSGAVQTPCTAVATGAGGFSQPLTVSYSSDTTDVGTVTASASFPGNASYGASSASTTFAITAAPATVSLSNLVQTYSASPEAVTVTTVPSGLAITTTYTGTNTTSYGPTAAAPTNPGTYSVVAMVADPNYAGQQSGTLTINQVDPALSLGLPPGMPASTPYGTTVYFNLAMASAPQCPSGSVQFYVDGMATGSPVVLGTSGSSSSGGTGTPAGGGASSSGGTPPSTPGGGGSSSSGGTPPSTPGGGSSTSSGSAPSTTGGGSASCGLPVQFQTATLTAGTHSIYAAYTGDTFFSTENSGTLSYTVTQDGTTVTLAASGTSVNVGQQLLFTATVTPVSQDNAQPPAGNVVFKDGSLQIGTSPLSATAPFTATLATSSLAAGSHNISATFVDTDGNFLGNSSPVAVETVNLIVPVINWTPSPTEFPYGTALGSSQLNAAAVDGSGNPISGSFSYNFASGTVLPAGTVNLTASFTPADPSTYASNSSTVTLKVDPVALTVTPNNQSIGYGKSIPALTYQVAGFVNKDNSTSLSTQPTCVVLESNGTTPFPAGSVPPAGNYKIQCSGAVDPNYTISYATGTLTVSQANLTITASSATITYGTTPAPITASYSGLVAGDSLTTAPTCSAQNLPSNNPAGTYTTNCSGALDSNYVIQYVSGSLTIKQAAQTITFTSPGTGPEVQGGTVTVSATGGASGNAVTFTSSTTSVCTLSSAGGITTASLIAPGPCAITANQAGNNNYSAAPPVTLSFSVTAVFVLTVNPASTSATPPGTDVVNVTLTPVNGFTGSVTLSCALPASLPTGAKCPGLPVTVKLAGGAAVVHQTGVLFPNGTQAGTYVVTFSAVSGKFNDSTTATFIEK
jgi:hypothetical protein